MVDLPDAPTEAGTDYDGVLSYSVEWHALTIGIVVGAVSMVSGRWEFAALLVAVALGVRAAPVPPLTQLRREPWYALGGILFGVAFGWLAVMLA